MSEGNQQFSDRNLWGKRGTAGATFAGNIAFENVSFSVGSLDILKNVSFTLKPGEIVSLLGPSGCGKTTLLRLAAGVSMPTVGRILIDGFEVASSSKFVAPEKRNVGLMFQDFALFPHMSVIDNVAYGLYALDRKQALETASRALDRVGLSQYRDAFPSHLSGGEQQRVALARAIVPRPQVMLLDEPFSGLDQRLRETVRAETLALLRETRATSIFVTHDPAEALEISDRILYMRAGELLQAGTPKQLYDQPVDAQAARFFSDMNELEAVVQNGEIRTVLGVFPAKNWPDGTQVTLMIRPHALQLSNDSKAVEGFVREARYLGNQSKLVVNFSGLESPLAALVAGPKQFMTGQSSRFCVDQSGILIFKK
jgi:iron(III) transport system ATP-binding protein